MNKMEATERLRDSELLTESVLVIGGKIQAIEDRYKMEIAPLRQEVKKLEQAFLDKYLVDSSGKSILLGMTLEKGGKRFKVLEFDHPFVKYLGNVRVSVLPEGKKRAFKICYGDLPEYTIVD